MFFRNENTIDFFSIERIGNGIKSNGYCTTGMNHKFGKQTQKSTQLYANQNPTKIK